MTTETTNQTGHDDRLIDDAIIADLFCLSLSWVRKERFNRRHGLPHTLTVDPIMVGASPRYRESDVLAFLQKLSSTRKGNRND